MKENRKYYAIVEVSTRTDVLDDVAIFENSANNPTYTSAIISEYEDTDGNGLGAAYDEAKAEFTANYTEAEVKKIEGTNEYDVKFWTLTHFTDYVNDDGSEHSEAEDLDVSHFPQM